MIPFLHTQSGLSLCLRGRPYTIATSDKNFSEILDAIRADETEGQILARIEAVQRSVRRSLSLHLEYNDGDITYRGRSLHNYAACKLIEFIDQDLPIMPLVNFIELVMQNPSARVVEQLYQFLEKGNLPLTVDGHFMAYKAVRADWKDIHSGTVDNSVGTSPEMPRNQVNDNPNETCSYGLHVCSYDYLKHFAQPDGHVVAVKVNPADVVSIPRDYDCTKMRVCRYQVVTEVTDYYENNVRVLSEAPMYGSCPVGRNLNGVPYAYHVIDSEGTIQEELDDFEGALKIARDILDEDDCPSSSVIRTSDGETVASFSA